MAIADVAESFRTGTTPKAWSDPFADVESQAATARQDWAAFDEDQARPGGIDFFGLKFGSQRQGVGEPSGGRPPSLEDFGGDRAAYENALRGWADNRNYEGEYADSNFDTVMSGRTEGRNSMQRAAFNDIRGMRETEQGNFERGLQIAGDFDKNQKAVTQGERARLEESYAGVNQGIDQARNRVTEDVAVQRQRAEGIYSDLQGRFDQLNRMISTKETAALGEFRNETARMVDMGSQALRDAGKAAISETIAQYGQMGRSLDDPVTQAAVRNTMQTVSGQVSQLGQKAWTDYNQSRLEARKFYSELAGQVGTSGLSTLQQAGAQLGDAYVKSGETLANAEKWAETEKANVLYQKGMLSSTIASLELQGETTAASMLQMVAKRQWIPEFPFVQALYDTAFRDEQADISNFFTGLNAAISIATLGFGIMGKGPAAKPEAPDTSSSSDALGWATLGLSTADTFS